MNILNILADLNRENCQLEFVRSLVSKCILPVQLYTTRDVVWYTLKGTPSGLHWGGAKGGICPPPPQIFSKDTHVLIYYTCNTRPKKKQN